MEVSLRETVIYPYQIKRKQILRDIKIISLEKIKWNYFFNITSGGGMPLNRKVETIADMLSPKNNEELHKIILLVN